MELRSGTDAILLMLTNSSDNYFIRPVSDTATIWAGQPNTYGGADVMTLAQWKTFSGYDLLSKKSPFTVTQTSHILFDYTTSVSKTVTLSNYKDLDGNAVTGYTLAPYSSIILLTEGIPIGTIIKSYGKIVKF